MSSSKIKMGIRLVQGRRGEAYSSSERTASVLGDAGGKREKSGADRPLVEEVTVSVDDIRLGELSLNERDDMGEFVFSTVCAIGDSVHG
jgi:hypothetical protein